MKVARLTREQAEELHGKEFMPSCYFNPIQDANNNWIISTQEVNDCTNPEFTWVKDLPLIEYKPKQVPNPFNIQ